MWQVLKQIITKIYKNNGVQPTTHIAFARYEAHAVVFQEFAKRLLERLAIMRIQPQVIVELGAGIGLLTASLKPLFTQTQLLAIDLDKTALAYAKQQKKITNKFVSAICSSPYQVPLASQSVDLIVAHLLPLWCDNVPALLAEVKRLLKPGGLFICSSLGPDSLKELNHYLHQPIGSTVQDKLMDMHILGDELMRAGLAEPVIEMELQQVSYSSTEALIQELKYLNLLSPSALAHPPSSTSISSEQEEAILTFELIYAHAWQAHHEAQTQATAAEVYIPIYKIQRKSAG